MGQAKHGKRYVVKVGTSGVPATPTDRSNQFKSIDFEENAELLDSTAFGDTDKTYEVGFKDNKFSGSGNWTAALDAHFGAILGHDTAMAFELGPEGSATGSVKYTGNCRLVSFKKNGSVSALNTFTAEFQITGPVTRGTYA
jgi:hypothetical protein